MPSKSAVLKEKEMEKVIHWHKPYEDCSKHCPAHPDYKEMAPKRKVRGTVDRDLNIKAQVYAAGEISKHIINKFPLIFDNQFLDDFLILYNFYRSIFLSS